MPRTDDPLEKYNRKVYAFNDFVDRNAIRPIAVGYRKITNDEVRTMVSNFFTNLRAPITIVNDVLQAEPGYAAAATGRFVVNSTIGIGGLFDPASRWGMVYSPTDMDVTFARWGLPEGPYLVLPLLGSGSPRELLGFGLDSYFLDPVSYFEREHDWSGAEYLPEALYLTSLRSSLIEAESVTEGAYDPYIFYRDAYRQRRLYLAYRGNPPIEAVEKLQGNTQGIDVDKLLREQRKYDQQQKKRTTPPPKGGH